MKLLFTCYIFILTIFSQTTFAQNKSEEEHSKLVGEYLDKGNNYYFEENYPEALNFFFKGLTVAEQEKDSLAIYKACNNIGIIYNSLENFEQSLIYHQKALQLSLQSKNVKNTIRSHNSLGNVYANKNDLDEALKQYNAALDLTKNGSEKSLAAAYSGVGNVLHKQGHFNAALKYMYLTLDIINKLNDSAHLSSAYMNIAETYQQLKNIDSSKLYAEKAYVLSTKTQSKNEIKDYFLNMAFIDTLEGKWESAFKNYLNYNIYKDSIDAEGAQKKVTQLTLQNEFDKKEVLAESEKRKQKVILVFVCVILLLVIVFTIITYRALSVTKTQKQIIEVQKAEVSAQKEILSEKNKEITDSINYAKRIQGALLASKELLNQQLNSINNTSPNHFIFYQPKDIVSGDFYWASTLNDGSLAFVTADSTGHGVPGAIMSMINISCLNEAINIVKLTSPDEILNYTRTRVIEFLKNDGSIEGGKDGMDCSLMIINQTKTQLKYAAANNPIWIIRNSELIELKPDKMPVGKYLKDNMPFTMHSIDLLKGDIIYTLTDGMPDQFGGADGKKYMSKRLKQFIVSISNLPMDKQKQEIESEINNWKANTSQVDDITLIGIQIG